MNKDDIKKALECCSNSRVSSCNNCPYNNNGEFSCCDGEMCKDALNLITEQEEEIERLKDEDTRLTEKLKQVLLAVDTVKEMTAMCNIDKQNAEIERLKAENCELTKKLEARLTCDFVKTAQTHAVQDFAEKIKEKYSLYDDRHILYRIIDELLKEYE